LAVVSHRRRIAALVVALGALLTALGPLPGRADAALPGPYFVSPTGSDAGDGSALHPWRSIAKATRTAPAGSVIVVSAGTYGGFRVTRPGQTVTAAPGERVVVKGRSGVRDVVLVTAPGVTVAGLTVTGCVPDPTPPGNFNDEASSNVRIDDGATGVVLRDLTIRGSRFRNQYGLLFGCVGIMAHRADASRIVRNDIAGTAAGVYVNGGARDTVVADNRIHDNNVLVRNTPGRDDDYGAIGIGFSNVDAVPGPVATRNVITGNAGPSSDYGYDGGAFEIYNSSFTTIVGNTIRNNENVLETGASPEGGACVGNTFTGNESVGRTAGSRLKRSIGMILRCATAMVVDHNTFTGLDWWVYELSTADRFSTDVNGLAITGNTHRQRDRVYRLAIDPVAARLVVEANRFPVTGPWFASYGDGSGSRTLAQWQQRTGLDRVSPAA
jgi:nitrous oxidase accessory protein NosD